MQIATATATLDSGGYVKGVVINLPTEAVRLFSSGQSSFTLRYICMCLYIYFVFSLSVCLFCFTGRETLDFSRLVNVLYVV